MNNLKPDQFGFWSIYRLLFLIVLIFCTTLIIFRHELLISVFYLNFWRDGYYGAFSVAVTAYTVLITIFLVTEHKTMRVPTLMAQVMMEAVIFLKFFTAIILATSVQADVSYYGLLNIGIAVAMVLLARPFLHDHLDQAVVSVSSVLLAVLPISLMVTDAIVNGAQ